jgi:hypothetical protein
MADQHDEILSKISEYFAEIGKVAKGMTGAMDKATANMLTAIYAFDKGYLKTKEQLEEALDVIAHSPKFKGTVSDFRKMFKDLEVSDQFIENIIDKKKELDKLDTRSMARIKSYRDLLDIIYDTEGQRANMAEEISNLYDQLNRQVLRQQKHLKSLGIPLQNQAEALEHMVSSAMNLGELFRPEILNVSKLEEQVSNLNTLIDNVGQQDIELPIHGKMDFDKAIDVLDDISKHQLKLLDDESKVRKRKLFEYAAATRGLQVDLSNNTVVKDDGTKISGAAQKSVMKSLGNQSDLYEQLIGKIIEQGDLTDAQRAKLSETEYILLKQAALADATTQEYKEQLSVSADNVRILQRYVPFMKKIEAGAEKIAGVFSGITAMLPAGVSSFLGLDDAIEKIHSTASRVTDTFKKKVLETGDASLAMREALKGFGPAILQAINPMTLLIAGTLLLFKLASEIGEKWREMAHEMGISLAQSKQLYELNLDTVSSYKNQFATLKDIEAVQTSLIGATGMVLEATSKKGQELAVNLAEVGKLFAYSADTAVHLHKVFTGLGADDKLAQQLQRNLGFMSEMAGLSPKIVAEDLVNASNEVATFFAGMPDKAAKAAIQVRRLGMSLQQAGQIAKRMMNLEGFMTDMYELASMTGAGVDFSKAFEYGLSGELEKMTEEMMNAIGSLDKFNSMDHFQRSKIANTLGMEVDEVQKSLALREKMVNLGPKEQAYLNEHINQIGDIAAMSQDDVKNRLAQLQATDRLGVAWDKIKAVLIKAVLPFVEAFANALDALMPVIDLLIFGLKLVTVPLRWMAELVSVVSMGFQPIAGFLRDIVAGIGGFFEGTEKVNDAVGTTQATLSSVMSPLEAIGKFIGVYLVGRFTGLNSVIGSVGASLFSWLKVGPMMGRMLGGLKGNIGKVGLLGAAAFGVMGGGIGDFIGPAERAISSVFNFFGKSSEEAATDGESTLSGMFSGASHAGIGMWGSMMFYAKKFFDILPEGSQKFITSFSIAGMSINRMFGGISKVGRKMFGKLLPSSGVLTEALLGTDDVLTKAATTATVLWDHTSKEVAEMFHKRTGGGLKRAFAPLLALPRMVGQLAGAIGKDMFGLFKTLTAPMATLARKTFEPFLSRAQGAFSTMTDYGKKAWESISSRAVGSFGKAQATGGGVFKKLLERAGGAWQTVTAGGTRMWQTVADYGRKIATSLQPVVSSIWGPVKKVGMSVFDAVASYAKKLFPHTASFIGSTMDKLKEKFSSKASTVASDAAGKVTDIAKDKAGSLIDKAKEKLSGKAEELTDKATGKATEIVNEKRRSMFEKIKEKITRKSTVSNTVTEAIDPSKGNGADAVADKAKQTANNTQKQVSSFQSILASGVDGIKAVLGAARDVIKTALEAVIEIVKTAWQGLKALLTDMVEFVGNALKTLSEAAGKAVQNLLTGLSQGLSSFNTGALKGAAALVVVAGAIWIAADAFGKFADVDWGDMLKGVVALGVLTGAAHLLGKSTGAMVKGAGAIALLGASLLPAAYAMKVFNSVDWTSLGKAAGTLVVLGAAAAVFGKLAPQMVIAAVGITAMSISLAALGASLLVFNAVDWSSLGKAGAALVGLGVAAVAFATLLPVAIPAAIAITALSASLLVFGAALHVIGSAMEKVAPLFETVFDGLSQVVYSIGQATEDVLEAAGNAAVKIVDSLRGLTDIDVGQLFNLSAGITAVGAALLGFSALSLGSGVLSTLTSLTGGGALGQLKELAEIANPLQTAAAAVQLLADALSQLTGVLASADFTQLNELGKIRNIGVAPTAQTAAPAPVGERSFDPAEPGIGTLPSTVSGPAARPAALQPRPPLAKATGQNVSIKDPKIEQIEAETQAAANAAAPSSGGDFGGNSRKLEQLMREMMREMITALHAYANRPAIAVIDDSALPKISGYVKKSNNRLG